MLLLEFQSAVDRAMAVRMLTYTGLLYEKLIGEGELRAHGALPPVLPVVIYNGSGPWSAAVEVADLIESGEPALARHQPSLRYFLLDEGRAERGDLPPGNLVSALIALEANRDRERLPFLLDELIVLLREQDDEELTNAFAAWARQALVPRRRRAEVPESLPGLQEVRTMLAETVQEWAAPWVEKAAKKGSRRAAPRSERCCAAKRRSSSMPPPGGVWPRRWRASATRTAWRRSAAGSSSAARPPNCSPALPVATRGTEAQAPGRRPHGSAFC